jgi:hypothetical protein
MDRAEGREHVNDGFRSELYPDRVSGESPFQRKYKASRDNLRWARLADQSAVGGSKWSNSVNEDTS